MKKFLMTTITIAVTSLASSAQAQVIKAHNTAIAPTLTLETSIYEYTFEDSNGNAGSGTGVNSSLVGYNLENNANGNADTYEASVRAYANHLCTIGNSRNYRQIFPRGIGALHIQGEVLNNITINCG